MINISTVNSQVIIKKRKPQCSSLKKRYKERESAWNDRIIISEQILYLRTKESLNKKRLPKLQNTTATIVQKYINIHKQQQQQVEIEECEQKIFETKLDQLRQLYKVYCIPKIHQNLFNTLLETSSNKRTVVEEELNLMNQKLAPIQHCMFVIIARENCLKQVLALVKQNQPQIDQISDKLKDLRMLNLTTLENIVKWQQYFQNKNLNSEFQLDDNTPYHQRFYNDYLELKPQLMNLFKVSDWPDPFFIQLLGKGQQRLYIRVRRAEAELKQAEYELYKRLKLLGEGAFGKAYLVECLQDKSLWVSKYMDLAAMTNQEKDETLREAKILEFLSHPNIVRFREVYKTKKGRLCIVMEYADGGDLSQKIKEAKGKYLPEAQILDWFTQICLAIKHVHDRKIIHRDLKGQNIFLNKEGQVKLGDFGIARILKITLEKAKTMVGTPYYISPEIIEGKPYTFMTDIWSLGVILYELCTLQPPFKGDSLHVLALNIVKGQYKPISADYSKELKQLVQQLLQVDYRRRPTIQEILKMPVITNRIKSFLSETIQKQEFSHTIFHNKVFEIKGNLNQVNLILNEQPCPPQMLEQNAKNLKEFPEIIKKPSLQEFDVVRPPQISKQQQQQPSSRQADPQKDAPKLFQQQEQYKKQDIQKQIDVPKKIDPIIKNSPLIQKKDISKETPQQKEVIKQSPKQQYPLRPKSDQVKQQKSEPCKFDVKVQKKHSNSEQALIPDQKKQQFISPKNQQKLDQPRPPTAPKEKPKPQIGQQRPQSSRPQIQEQQIIQKVNVEQKRRISVDKVPAVQPQQQKQQQLEQQLQEERIRQLKQKQQQEQLEKEKKEKQYQIQQQEQLLEKQRQLDKQQQLEKQKQQQQQLLLQKQKQKEIDQLKIEEKQRNIQNQQISKMNMNRNEQQKQNLERQPSQKSSQIESKQHESKQQIKSKADQLQKMEKNVKDFDLMFKELEGLINNVHNAIEKFPNQGGKENYFDQNLIQTNLIEDREDDEDEPTDQDYKKPNYMVKQISKEDEYCLDILNKQDQKISTLKIKLENALGQEKMNKAKYILKSTLEKMDLDTMEKQYGPNYEKLLPFLTLEERKTYAPLLFTYIIVG